MNKGCLQEWIERNKTRLSHFESLVFLANRQVHFIFFFKKRIRGVALFCGQMFNQEQWFFSFETFVCAWFENIHPSTFPKWKICSVNINITQIVTLSRFDKFIIAYTCWVVPESFLKKKRKRKERKNEVENKVC